MQDELLRGIQDFIADVFSISTVRRMGPQGTLNSVHRYLKKKVDLKEVGKCKPKKFRNMLDDMTLDFQRALKRETGVGEWGAARKCLNIFLRDATCNYYLRNAYDLSKLEDQLEVPLDSRVGKSLKDEQEGMQLPRWDAVKRLTPELSDEFQNVASIVATRRGILRSHLDFFYWPRP